MVLNQIYSPGYDLIPFQYFHRMMDGIRFQVDRIAAGP